MLALYEGATDWGEPFLQRVVIFDPDRRCWRNVDIDLKVAGHGELTFTSDRSCKG